jgi:hypothetical protein
MRFSYAGYTPVWERLEQAALITSALETERFCEEVE